MKNYAKYITEDVLQNWFSSETIPDPQLKHFINSENITPSKPNFKEVSRRLFGCDNLYDAYRPELMPSPMSYNPHIGQNTLNALEGVLGHRPTFGVEVGSFIGGSATLLGTWMRESGGTLLCVDPWCGDINMWLLPNFAGTMRKVDGDPVIFKYFMNAMFNAGLTQTVVPLRTTSVIAARMMRVLKWQVEFAYLDSAHECGETFLELSLYYDLIQEGGVIFGDDYMMFPAVKHDVDLFCNIHNKKLNFTGDGDTWFIVKG